LLIYISLINFTGGENMPDLLSSYTLKGKTVKNRLVFPPCVCFNYAGDDGIVTTRNVEHYEAMAKGGAGLIVAEATCINKNGRLHATQLGIWDDAHIDGLSKIADAIHSGGALALIQIHHAGYKTAANAASPEDIFTASDYDLKGNIIRGATYEEVEGVIKDFAQAAARAHKAGFDGIEIHGAHDYLLSQFLSADVNKREDEYGKNRLLIHLKVVEAIKAVVPDDFIVAIRFGSNDDSMADGIKYAKELEAAGVELLNISSGHSRKPADMEEFEGYHWVCQLGMNIKKHVNIPTICVFGVSSPQMANEIVKNELCDFAAAAKGLLADPNWIVKYEKGEEITPCAKCERCQFFTDGANCPARSKIQ